MAAIQNFYRIYERSINATFVALIIKKVELTDFRPISLSIQDYSQAFGKKTEKGDPQPSG